MNTPSRIATTLRAAAGSLHALSTTAENDTAARKPVRRSTIAAYLFLATAMLTVGSPASAADTVTLRYSTAELGTPLRASHLYQRIERLARSHCTTPGRRSLGRMSVEAQCIDEIVDRLVDRMGNQVLTAIHLDRRNARKVASL